jgi:4-oxalocrotonate tautomerase
MPVINVKIAKTPTNKKKELIEKLTKTASEITSIPEEHYVVFIEEFEQENIGIAGQTLFERKCVK